MDDMDGLDFFGDMDEIDSLGDLFDFEEWFSADALMSDAIAALSGAGGILAVSAAVPWLSEKILPADMTVENKSYIRSGMGLVAAFIGGRILWRVDKRASAGFVGAVGGLALAQLVGGFANLQVGFAALPEEEALAGMLGNGEQQELSQLSAAVAEASRRDFAGSTTVTAERLQGYQPFLS